jgi:hypothetical protein
MPTEGTCLLKSCRLDSEVECIAHVSRGAGDRTSAFIEPFRKAHPAPPGTATTAAIVASGARWGLANFTMEILEAAPKTAGIYSEGGVDFTIDNINVQLSQTNCSSALCVTGFLALL